MEGARPVNLMYGLKGAGNVYQITLINKNLTPKETKNAPYYLVLAPNDKVAREYAKARLTHALSKEAGMAKYAIGIAQAHVSNKPMNVDGPSGSRQMRRAYEAAQVAVSSGDGTFGMHVRDALNYASLAQKGGAASLSTAIQKAANRTAGIINKLAKYRLDEPIPTPFPEIAGK